MTQTRFYIHRRHKNRLTEPQRDLKATGSKRESVRDTDTGHGRDGRSECLLISLVSPGGGPGRRQHVGYAYRF